MPADARLETLGTCVPTVQVAAGSLGTRVEMADPIIGGLLKGPSTPLIMTTGGPRPSTPSGG